MAMAGFAVGCILALVIALVVTSDWFYRVSERRRR
jgi:hypothetical protein